MQRKEEPRIYTEYDARRRAEKIAGDMLRDCIAKLEEIEQNAFILLRNNSELREKLKAADEAAAERTKALIYYDETYNRLSREDKEKFNSVAKGVVIDYGLPFNVE